MRDLESVKQYFINDRYAMVTTGIEILEADDNYAKCALKIDERHRNATGHCMGGAIYTLADFAFAVASNTPEKVTVTTVSQISFLGSPKSDMLYAECRAIKDGRRNCFFETMIRDDLGNPVASVTAGGAHL